MAQRGDNVQVGWLRPKSEFYIRVAYFSLNLEIAISRFDINKVIIFTRDYTIINGWNELATCCVHAITLHDVSCFMISVTEN